MPSGKPFICWLGPNNEDPLYIGDEVFYQLTEPGKWIAGKIGYKRSGGLVVRAGRKEHPVYMRTQLRLKG